MYQPYDTSSARRTGRRDGRALRAAQRDDALGRLRSLLRTAVVGSVAAVGVLTAYVAHAIPGHTYSTTPSQSSGSAGASTGGSSGTVAPSAGSGSLGGSGSLSPAAQAPAQTQVPQQTSTGSSGF